MPIKSCNLSADVCTATGFVDLELESSHFCSNRESSSIDSGYNDSQAEAVGPPPCKMTAECMDKLQSRDEELRKCLKSLKDRQAAAEKASPHIFLVGDTVRATRARYTKQGADVEIQASWSGVVARSDENGDLLIDFGGIKGCRWVLGRHAATCLDRSRGPAAFTASLTGRWCQCLRFKQRGQ